MGVGQPQRALGHHAQGAAARWPNQAQTRHVNGLVIAAADEQRAACAYRDTYHVTTLTRTRPCFIIMRCQEPSQDEHTLQNRLMSSRAGCREQSRRS